MSKSQRLRFASEEVRARLSVACGGVQIFIYNANTFELLSIQPSARAAGRYCNISGQTVIKYLRSGQTYNGYRTFGRIIIN